MSLYPLFPTTNQFQSKNGSNLVDGILRVYYASRTDEIPSTYKDADGTILNPEDIILDNNGRATVYVDPCFAYNLFVYDSDEHLQWTQYNIFPEGVVDIVVSGMNSVAHDSTMSGDGTSANPLGINTDELATKYYVDYQDASIVNNVSNQFRIFANDLQGLHTTKQDRLTAGTYIEITDDNTINCTYSGGGSSDNDKVAVASGKAADYLKNVLVSDCDEITLSEVGNRYKIGVNLVGEQDPKLSTMHEFAINSGTSNYGSYELNPGYNRLLWDDRSSYNWLNAQIYQCMRLSDAQGSITKCNLVICGSIQLSNPPACLNIGVFDLSGNLLGMTGLKFLGTDFLSGAELCCFDMIESFTDSLRLKRNTRYIIQLWSCGLQIAAIDKGNSYNYVYDFNLRQNLCTTVSTTNFCNPMGSFNNSPICPYISFGTTDLT